MTMFQITGDTGAPLCASLDIMLHLLDTLPSFPANLSYQSNSPIICGFASEAYAQPWLGLHSLNLACTPSFDSPQEGQGCFEGGYYPEYRGWCSLYSEDRSVRLYLHSTHTDQERCRSTPAGWSPPHFFLYSLLSIQTQMRQVPFSATCSQSDSTSSDEGLVSEHGSRGSHSSSSSSSGLGSGSGSGSWSHDGSPARSEASAGMRSSPLMQTASVGSVEVLSGDEASGG